MEVEVGSIQGFLVTGLQILVTIFGITMAAFIAIFQLSPEVRNLFSLKKMREKWPIWLPILFIIFAILFILWLLIFTISPIWRIVGSNLLFLSFGLSILSAVTLLIFISPKRIVEEIVKRIDDNFINKINTQKAYKDKEFQAILTGTKPIILEEDPLMHLEEITLKLLEKGDSQSVIYALKKLGLQYSKLKLLPVGQDIIFANRLKAFMNKIGEVGIENNASFATIELLNLQSKIFKESYENGSWNITYGLIDSWFYLLKNLLDKNYQLFRHHLGNLSSLSSIFKEDFSLIDAIVRNIANLVFELPQNKKMISWDIVMWLQMFISSLKINEDSLKGADLNIWTLSFNTFNRVGKWIGKENVIWHLPSSGVPSVPMLREEPIIIGTRWIITILENYRNNWQKLEIKDDSRKERKEGIIKMITESQNKLDSYVKTNCCERCSESKTCTKKNHCCVKCSKFHYCPEYLNKLES